MRLLITGAGFSKAWGLPLTRELADVMRKTLQAIPESESSPTVEHLKSFLKELQRSHGSYPDLEDVLTILREGMDEEYESGWEERARNVWQQLSLDPANLWKIPPYDVVDPTYHYYALQWALAAALYWNMSIGIEN